MITSQLIQTMQDAIMIALEAKEHDIYNRSVSLYREHIERDSDWIHIAFLLSLYLDDFDKEDINRLYKNYYSLPDHLQKKLKKEMEKNDDNPKKACKKLLLKIYNK